MRHLLAGLGLVALTSGCTGTIILEEDVGASEPTLVRRACDWHTPPGVEAYFTDDTCAKGQAVIVHAPEGAPAVGEIVCQLTEGDARWRITEVPDAAELAELTTVPRTWWFIHAPPNTYCLSMTGTISLEWGGPDARLVFGDLLPW